MNYNICSTDWSFPLIIHSSDTKAKKYENKKTKKNSKTKHANKQTSENPQKRREIEIRIKNSQMRVFSALLQLNKYHL